MMELLAGALAFTAMWGVAGWAERRRADRRSWLDALADVVEGRGRR